MTKQILFVDVVSNENLSDKVVIFKEDTHEKKREHFLLGELSR